VLIEERDDAVIISRGDRRLAVIELGERHLAVGIDESLLIDPADPFEGADVEGVLRAAIAGALALELPLCLIALAGAFEGAVEQAVERGPIVATGVCMGVWCAKRALSPQAEPKSTTARNGRSGRLAPTSKPASAAC
jgi:hypothetical protein